MNQQAPPQEIHEFDSSTHSYFEQELQRRLDDAEARARYEDAVDENNRTGFEKITTTYDDQVRYDLASKIAYLNGTISSTPEEMEELRQAADENKTIIKERLADFPNDEREKRIAAIEQAMPQSLKDYVMEEFGEPFDIYMYLENRYRWSLIDSAFIDSIKNENGEGAAAESRATELFVSRQGNVDETDMSHCRHEVVRQLIDIPGATVNTTNAVLEALRETGQERRALLFKLENNLPLLDSEAPWKKSKKWSAGKNEYGGRGEGWSSWRDLQRDIMFYGLSPDTTVGQITAYKEDLKRNERAKALGLDPDSTEEEIRLASLKEKARALGLSADEIIRWTTDAYRYQEQTGLQIYTGIPQGKPTVTLQEYLCKELSVRIEQEERRRRRPIQLASSLLKPIATLGQASMLASTTSTEATPVPRYTDDAFAEAARKALEAYLKSK